MPKKKEHNVPKVGTIWETTFKKRKYVMKVVSTRSGIGYEVGGRLFKSPSGAAQSITKTGANGWVFWKIEEKSKSGSKS
jgi:hypothetical protein